VKSVVKLPMPDNSIAGSIAKGVEDAIIPRGVDKAQLLSTELKNKHIDEAERVQKSRY
jgi:hypothetical protein